MRDRLARLRFGALALLMLGGLLPSSGCTRHFFRERADKQAEQMLREKDVIPNAKIEQFHVYPDPRARFADPTNPDRPLMPPDDPMAKMLAPNPQRAKKGGIARVEGTGYISLLEAWDSHNRERKGENVSMKVALGLDDNGIVQTSINQAPENRIELPTPRRLDGTEGPKPYLVTLDQAVELGILNSREFQTRREDLYLLALPVTLQRFGFAAQFFAVEDTIRERTGAEVSPYKGDRWRANSDVGFTKLFSTGALLLFQYANRTAINLTNNGQQRMTSFSTLNLDIVQPFLRGGGRAVTLEPLTQVERNLVYEIRDYARFRKQYFQYISGGNDLTRNLLTPTALGTSLVPGTTRLNSGNNARPSVLVGNAARLDLSAGTDAVSEGYLPTLLKKSTAAIENLNLNRLSGVVKLFEAYEGGGRVSSLQVGQVQLQILQTKSNFYQLERDYRDSLDRFKFQLGIPVDIPLELEDEIMQPVMGQYTRYERMIEQFNEMLAEVDRMDPMDQAGALRGRLGKLLTDAPLTRATQTFRTQFPKRWQAWQLPGLDDKALQTKLLALRKERNDLLDDKTAQELKDQTLEPAAAERLRLIERDLPTGEFEQAVRRYEAQPWRALAIERSKREEHLARFRDVRNGFSEILGEASNERLEQLRPQWPKLPGINLDGIDLVAGDLEQSYDAATRTALELRLDLMNTRAQVVDSWRQIAVNANSLLGAFNVGYHLDSSTPPDQARPLAFSGSRTRHQLFMNFELPLVRMAERNAYRASLVAYQRARRGLMAAEDSIAIQVRNEVRQLQVLAKNFKIQQQAVELAYLQVESSLETFQAPPTPGAGGDNAGTAAALTQQLLNAYARLPREQTQLLNIWINYQIVRQQLYLDLELLPLDFRGVWIDELFRQPDAGPRLLPPVSP